MSQWPVAAVGFSISFCIRKVFGTLSRANCSAPIHGTGGHWAAATAIPWADSTGPVLERAAETVQTGVTLTVSAAPRSNATPFEP